jgi:hypothetical protein
MENKIVELDDNIINDETNNITLNIYIVHRSDFEQRKKLMEENLIIFKKLGYNIKWNYIEKHTNEYLTNNIQTIVKDIKIEKTLYPEYDELMDNLHINHISNIFNHLESLNKIKEHYNKLNEEDKGTNLYIILEDDVFLMNIFEEQMKMILESIIKGNISYDLIFLGVPISIDNKTEDKKNNDIIINETLCLNFIPQYLKFLPSCDSFIINPVILNNEQLFEDINKIRLQYHFELSYIIKRYQLKSYYTSPHLMLDGSKMGIIPSSINLNNIHIYNNEFMNMINILNINEEEFNKNQEKYEEEFNKNYDKVKEFDNPDILHLNAIFHNKMKKHETALNIFKHAHKRYSEMPSNITNESNFIMDYVKTYERIQNN